MKEKLEIKEIENKNSNIKWIILAIAIIAIILLLSFAYNKYKNKQEYEKLHKEYNYYEFDKEGLHWKTSWITDEQEYIIRLRHWPGELEDIEVTGSMNQVFNKSKDIYLTFHPEGNDLDYVALAATELSLNINNALKRNIIAACLVNKTIDCAIRPIVTCADDDKAVIYLKQADTPKVVLSDNCIIIEGNDEDLVKAAERILYAWYGIMPR